jgi:hypothetical protein
LKVRVAPTSKSALLHHCCKCSSMFCGAHQEPKHTHTHSLQVTLPNFAVIGVRFFHSRTSFAVCRSRGLDWCLDGCFYWRATLNRCFGNYTSSHCSRIQQMSRDPSPGKHRISSTFSSNTDPLYLLHVYDSDASRHYNRTLLLLR